MTYPGAWTHQTCGTCIWYRSLRGRVETRFGCVVALYAWYRRHVPEDVERAEVVDVVELVRRRHTSRRWIELAVRRGETTQACPWWEMREAPVN